MAAVLARWDCLADFVVHWGGGGGVIYQEILSLNTNLVIRKYFL